MDQCSVLSVEQETIVENVNLQAIVTIIMVLL